MSKKNKRWPNHPITSQTIQAGRNRRAGRRPHEKREGLNLWLWSSFLV